MVGAHDTTDPIDAARDDIAGSKDLIASTIEDLSQHQRWLENYRVAETKHERRIRRKELMYQAELLTKRVLRALRRFALAVARTLRAISLFLGRVSVRVAGAIAAACVYLYGLARDAIVWTAPRARALAVAIGRLLAAAFAWTVLKLKQFALATLEEARIASAWTLRNLRAFARGALEEAKIASRWTLRNLRAFARGTMEEARVAHAWSERALRTTARATRNGIAAAYVWIAPRVRALSAAAYRTTAKSLSFIGAKSDDFRPRLVAPNVARSGMAWREDQGGSPSPRSRQRQALLRGPG